MSSLIYFLFAVSVVALVISIKRFIPFGCMLKEYEEKYHREDSCSSPNPAPPEFMARHDQARDKFFLSLKRLFVASASLFALLFVKIYFVEKSAFYALFSALDLVVFVYFVVDCFYISGEIGRLDHQCDTCARDKKKVEEREKRAGVLKKERRRKFFGSLCALVIFAVLLG